MVYGSLVEELTEVELKSYKKHITYLFCIDLAPPHLFIIYTSLCFLEGSIYIRYVYITFNKIYISCLKGIHTSILIYIIYINTFIFNLFYSVLL